MRRQKQVHDLELEQRLAAYKIPEIDSRSSEILLGKIMASISASQNRRPSSFAFGKWMRGWTVDAVAFACLALLGFWAGTGSFELPLYQTAVAHRSTLTRTEYLGQNYYGRIVFGPKSWKEVSL
jgi:hypothetical protein